MNSAPTIPTHRRPTPPGEILLREFLQPMGVTQAAFANRIGITTARLSEIVHGKRAVTQDTAKRFAQALGTSFEMWLRMQFAVDVYDAAHAPADKVIAAIKPFNVSVSDVRNGRVRRQQSAYGRKRS